MGIFWLGDVMGEKVKVIVEGFVEVGVGVVFMVCGKGGK